MLRCSTKSGARCAVRFSLWAAASYSRPPISDRRTTLPFLSRERSFATTGLFGATRKGYPKVSITATRQPVRRILNILACLTLVFSLETTAMAHALERPDVSASTHVTRGEEIAEGHTPRDADQVPADGDKGYPHHHGGCHGDHVAAPVKIAGTALRPDLRLAPVVTGRLIRPLSTADPALRPPQA